MAPKKDAKGGKSDPKAQAKAAKASSGGGKQKKKKWSTGKNKEKACGGCAAARWAGGRRVDRAALASVPHTLPSVACRPRSA